MFSACASQAFFMSACSLGLSATSQQYFSLRTNQPPATSQQYSSLRTNQSSATSQPNRKSYHLTMVSLFSTEQKETTFIPLAAFVTATVKG
jgi:hypothetical protein